MKKTLLAIIMTITMTTSFQANALIGGIIALSGGGPTVAFVGLGLTGTGHVTALLNSDDFGTVFLGAALMTVGLIVLDGEDGREISFSQMEESKLLDLGLSQDEALAYNENTEELSIAFSVVSGQLNAKSKVSEAEALWEEQAQIIGEAPIAALRKIVQAQK